MLRITRLDGNPAAIRLEGKLLALWVEEVGSLFGASDARSLPRLDLSRLTYVDAAGVDLLHELLRRGVQIESCSPYVAELLNWDPDKQRNGLCK